MVSFLVSSSSLLVGMVAAKPSQMEKPQLRQLAFPKSVSFVRSCPGSLSRNFADKRETSLTMQSLSLQRSNFRELELSNSQLDLAELESNKGSLSQLDMAELELGEG